MTTVDPRPGAAARPAPSPRDVPARRRVAAFVALTKPRIIELLLVTTVPTMIFAARGLPPLGLVVWTLLGGTLAAASANTLNCYLDRDIDVLMHRTERRPLVTGEVTPRAALVFGLVLGVAAVGLLGAPGQRALRRAGAGRDPLLRRGLHDDPQAPDAAEHRLGRRRRLHARAHRLVRGDGLAVVGRGRALRRDLPLDAAALLAAVVEVPRGLQPRRRADAPRRRVRRRWSRAASSSTPGPPRCGRCC